MGFLDRLFGRPQPQPPQYQQPQRGYTPPAGYQQPQRPARTEDEQAIARYRYLLRTAPPEAVEQAHAEAFARLTPEQRRQVLAQMSQDLPVTERPTSDDPVTLARTATRAELRQPGYLERSFGGVGMGGGMGGGMSMGRMIGGSMLGTIAGVVIGSAVADMFMGGFDQWDHDTFGGEQEAASLDEGGSMDENGDGVLDGAGEQTFADDASYDTAAGSGFDLGGFDGGGFDMGGGDFGGGFDSF